MNHTDKMPKIPKAENGAYLQFTPFTPDWIEARGRILAWVEFQVRRKRLGFRNRMIARKELFWTQQTLPLVHNEIRLSCCIVKSDILTSCLCVRVCARIRPCSTTMYAV